MGMGEPGDGIISLRLEQIDLHSCLQIRSYTNGIALSLECYNMSSGYVKAAFNRFFP